MEVIVLVAVVVILRLAGAAVTVLVKRRSAPGRPQAPASDPCLAPVLGLPPAETPNPERELVDGRMTGRMSREQYRAAMADLARRDKLIHPLGD